MKIAIQDSFGNDRDTIMTVEDRRDALADTIMIPAKSTSTRPSHQRRTFPQDSIDNRVDERMKEVQGHISGIKPADAARVCLLIEFCYLLELHQQAVDLHARLDRNIVDTDWLRRVDTFARASKMKLRR